MIDGTANWSLSRDFGTTPVIVGGTIQIDSTAKFVVNDGILKDLTVNGNMIDNFNNIVLVGDLDFNGNVARRLQFGHDSLFAGIPLIIRSGNFELGVAGGTTTITGTSGPPSITFGPDVVFKGGTTNATFTQPLINRGRIVAEQLKEIFFGSDVFHFTAAPVTNEGTLSAVNRAILRIANLAAPNSGIVSAGAGSSVQFTNTFAQASTGTTRIDIAGTAADKFGLVAVTGAATLAGTLEIQFAPGYVPVAGDRYKVLTYASSTGTFSSVSVKGLAAGLVVTPQYSGSDMTLVISAG